MNPLHRLIQTEIETSGPLPIGRYMHLCLSHPQHGYYQTRQPLGADGDFTTAPEISQLFGELIGAWLVHVWHQLGAPAPFSLVELGPGRGTLMGDIWRTAQKDQAFVEAAEIHLVETSPTLRAMQSDTLALQGLVPTHHDYIDTLPSQPTLWVANEFFDALPVDQWVRTPKGWNGRLVGLTADGELTFGVHPTPLPIPKAVPKSIADAPPGTILETSGGGDIFFGSIVTHLTQHDGAALIIDYGSLESGTGDTLQAVRNHQKVDPLEDPGQADLTTHVDFAHLAGRAGELSPQTATQGDFLLALGLLERAGQLGSGENPAQQEAISLAVERLAGDAGMGKLFKVMGLARPGIDLPGLNPYQNRNPKG